MIRIIAAAIGGVALGASGVALAFNSNPPMITRSYFLAPRGQSALIICMGANGAPAENTMPSFRRASAMMRGNIVAGEIICP